MDNLRLCSRNYFDIAINCQNVKFSKLGFADTPCPTTPLLEKAFYPSPGKIAIQANILCDGDKNWNPPEVEQSEILSFKGPF